MQWLLHRTDAEVFLTGLVVHVGISRGSPWSGTRPAISREPDGSSVAHAANGRFGFLTSDPRQGKAGSPFVLALLRYLACSFVHHFFCFEYCWKSVTSLSSKKFSPSPAGATVVGRNFASFLKQVCGYVHLSTYNGLQKSKSYDSVFRRGESSGSAYLRSGIDLPCSGAWASHFMCPRTRILLGFEKLPGRVFHVIAFKWLLHVYTL